VVRITGVAHRFRGTLSGRHRGGRWRREKSSGEYNPDVLIPRYPSIQKKLPKCSGDYSRRPKETSEGAGAHMARDRGHATGKIYKWVNNF
jgi:hypothetical protein